MKISELTAEDRRDIEEALEDMKSAQTDFWMAMSHLEQLLDYELDLDGSTDYEGWTVEDLLREVKDDEENGGQDQ